MLWEMMENKVTNSLLKTKKNIYKNTNLVLNLMMALHKKQTK